MAVSFRLANTQDSESADFMVVAAFDKEGRWKKLENRNRTAQDGGMITIIQNMQEFNFDPISLSWDAIKQGDLSSLSILKFDTPPTTCIASYAILVAVYDAQVIGLVKACWLQQQQATLAMLSVLPSFRRCGLGDALVAFAEAVLLKASEQPILNMQIEVLSMYPRLVQFYERQGYLKHGDDIPFVRPDIVREDIEPPTMTVLRKSLRI
jgi:GNAT superfamily N-acetyltransferase